MKVGQPPRQMGFSGQKKSLPDRETNPPSAARWLRLEEDRSASKVASKVVGHGTSPARYEKIGVMLTVLPSCPTTSGAAGSVGGLNTDNWENNLTV
ncbi:MAG: hypothetical protein JO266_15350 [Acidobacteria bacterium]|nr:hypothetical protein [Acidobacteriota bacterium]